ncbi:formate dehydrogenase subunit delta [Xanthobacter agilis]|uniref:Formate dehydrogenase subunit delta n=1 Tax=Xanthobacter agilis TaxID=47492 RepID=A0ABU0LC86_XANAG|nr:formate dehydrogenase subunit delta [Xanthobacter agilis]MDQ0504731.1 formate dehydrogenase subunit delta [Xanthobacter agilis]
MSHSTAEKLVYMANQIATAFAQQQHTAAVDATRTHIRKFWDPRMRAKIAEHVAAGGEGLSPVAKEALEGLPPVKAA